MRSLWARGIAWAQVEELTRGLYTVKLTTMMADGPWRTHAASAWVTEKTHEHLPINSPVSIHSSAIPVFVMTHAISDSDWRLITSRSHPRDTPTSRTYQVPALATLPAHQHLCSLTKTPASTMVLLAPLTRQLVWIQCTTRLRQQCQWMYRNWHVALHMAWLTARWLLQRTAWQRACSVKAAKWSAHLRSWNSRWKSRVSVGLPDKNGADDNSETTWVESVMRRSARPVGRRRRCGAWFSFLQRFMSVFGFQQGAWHR